jgi:hypothetical protein
VLWAVVGGPERARKRALSIIEELGRLFNARARRVDLEGRQPAWLRESRAAAAGQAHQDRRSCVRPAAGNDDGFAERSPIFLLADRVHGLELCQQLVDQRTQPRPRRAVRE